MRAFDRLQQAIFDDYRARTPRSLDWFERGREVLPGAVSGNLRYFAPHPLYMG